MTVVYARIPDELKAALDAYCEERRMKLTAAMVELMETGLDAVTNQATVESLQSRLAAAELDVATTRELATQAENARSAMAAQLERQSQAYELVAGRLNQPLGKCPNCKAAITGLELVVFNACQHCKKSLSSMLDPKTSAAGTLNGPEYALLIGALGLLVGMSLNPTKKA